MTPVAGRRRSHDRRLVLELRANRLNPLRRAGRRCRRRFVAWRAEVPAFEALLESGHPAFEFHQHFTHGSADLRQLLAEEQHAQDEQNDDFGHPQAEHGLNLPRFLGFQLNDAVGGLGMTIPAVRADRVDRLFEHSSSATDFRKHAFGGNC